MQLNDKVLEAITSRLGAAIRAAGLGNETEWNLSCHLAGGGLSSRRFSPLSHHRGRFLKGLKDEGPAVTWEQRGGGGREPRGDFALMMGVNQDVMASLGEQYGESHGPGGRMKIADRSRPNQRVSRAHLRRFEDRSSIVRQLRIIVTEDA